MQHTVITISREFGSGGRTIAKEVATACQIPCYDMEIIEKMAEKCGFSHAYVEKESERASIFRPFGQLSNQDYIWMAQRQVVLDLAKQGPCVLVGRCADAILDGVVDCLNVFVHASFEKRAERIVHVYGETEVPTERRLKDKDRRRAGYYQFYTERKWGDYHNYHLVVDSGALGIDTCVSLITQLYLQKTKA